MHADWWQRFRCPFGQSFVTDDFDYEMGCPRCGKALRLVSRQVIEDGKPALSGMPPPSPPNIVIRTASPFGVPKDVQRQ